MKRKSAALLCSLDPGCSALFVGRIQAAGCPGSTSGGTAWRFIWCEDAGAGLSRFFGGDGHPVRPHGPGRACPAAPRRLFPALSLRRGKAVKQQDNMEDAPWGVPTAAGSSGGPHGGVTAVWGNHAACLWISFCRAAWAWWSPRRGLAGIRT